MIYIYIILLFLLDNLSVYFFSLKFICSVLFQTPKLEVADYTRRKVDVSIGFLGDLFELKSVVRVGVINKEKLETKGNEGESREEKETETEREKRRERERVGLQWKEKKRNKRL